ncbi:MAG: ABC transporter permease [Anaerolineae bacterium]|nr:ABC transporter permease [Anaerolineae bacterium]
MTTQSSVLKLHPQTRPPARSIWWQAARRFGRNRMAIVGAVLFTTILIGAFGAPVLARYSYDQASFTEIWKPPSAEHWLGTDKVGRDVFSRLLYGMRTSLIIGFGVQIVVLAVGVILGTVSGMAGGKVDFTLMRVVDVVASFPTLLFAILAMSLLGSGVGNMMLALSISSWVIIAQLTRAQILSLRERDFVLASQSFGAPQSWIIRMHMIPNVIPPLIVSSTLAIPSYIVSEAGLTYLGAGINPPLPSLGQQIQEASVYLLAHPDYMLYTAITLAVLILAIAYIGDGLREALDPRALD